MNEPEINRGYRALLTQNEAAALKKAAVDEGGLSALITKIIRKYLNDGKIKSEVDNEIAFIARTGPPKE
jgi:hypothetical protein